MQRIEKVDVNTQENKELLQGIEGKFGKVPNIFATMAQAPAVLDAFMKFTGALSQGELSRQVQEMIALMMAGYNACHYCAAAHSLSAKGAQLSADDIQTALKGQAQDAKLQAVADFLKTILESKGHISDSDFQKVKDAGFSNSEIIEMIAAIAVNTMTNFFNSALKIELDFPKVNIE